MSGGLHMAPEELAIVRGILSRILPPGYRTYAFGSRATGVRLKPWSDLDLVIEGPAPLTFALSGQLREAFDESLLPWKVDIVDRATVSESFGRIVDADRVAVD
ncbi:MAG: nucleotidyltransferase domain-containing protein [Novosphingobium sp.]